MFGYACKQTKELMPLPILISHRLVQKIEEIRTSSKNIFFKSDCKSQVSIDYSDKKNPKIDNIVISAQHFENINLDEFREYVKNNVIIPIAKDFNMNLDFNCHVNSVGPFTIGGPEGDTGLTGRKIIVDTYGGYSKHGGGAFSGKDATKMDRSACYAARWIAKNIVAAELCDEVEIQLSYVIGHIQPVSINVNTFNSAKVPEEIIINIIRKVFDLSPLGIIKNLELNKPKYYYTSFFGHFGRDDLDLSWERLNKVDEIKKVLANLI
jgi:S-adenosylmethionine synthetase